MVAVFQPLGQSRGLDLEYTQGLQVALDLHPLIESPPSDARIPLKADCALPLPRRNVVPL